METQWTIIYQMVNCDLEKQFGRRGYVVAGLDEVGRGALAGPIAVGIVIFGPYEEKYDFEALEQLGINDSKQLTERQRVLVTPVIYKHSFLSAVAFSQVKFINKYGIVAAFRQAARKAVAEVMGKLRTEKSLFLLTDAFKIPYLKGVSQKKQLNIIKGDAKCLSIAAASIIAKVARDRYMARLSQRYSLYQWQNNKGYGTRDHIQALSRYGICPEHRAQFVRNIIQ